VFESLGFEVGWNDASRTATLTRNDFTVVITIGSRTFTTNGEVHTLDVPAQLIGGRTMLPIRFPLESVGYEVGWDGDTRTVIIESSAAGDNSDETRIVSGHYDIEIQANGNAKITETWVLYFDDAIMYTVYFREYFKPGYYEITEWSATLDGRQMTRMSEFNDSNPEYSFAAGEFSNGYLIEMYYRARAEKRKFTISYTVENAVKLYDDIADFMWDLTGENELSTIGTLTATVTAPHGASLDDFRIWAHGPFRGTFFKDSANQASLYIKHVLLHEIVDIRVCLPTELFHGGYYVGGKKLDEILRREQTPE
jgi:hypothetical protein